MSRLLISSAAAALLVGAGSLPSAAQVTADQVWENWQELMGAAGSTVMASESREGGVLTVSDVVSTVTEEGLTFTTRIPFLRFTENADGSVAVTMAPGIGMEMRDSEDEVYLQLEVSQPDTTITVAGTPDAMRYDFTSSEVGVNLIEFRAPNPGSGPDGTLDLSARMTGLSGSYNVTSGNVIGFASDSTIETMELMVDLTAPSERGHLRIDLTSGGIRSSGSIANMQLMSPEIDPLVAFQQGLSMVANLGYSDLALSFEFQDGRDRAEGSYSAESAELDFHLAADRLRYIVAMGPTQTRAVVPDFPFPVESSFAEARMGFDMPLTTTGGAAQEMAIVMRLVDLAVGEPLFAMVDPGQVIPRTPATVVFDVSGRGVIDVAQAAAMDDTFPGTLESLSLNELRLSFGGAEVTGSGGFTFDMTDTETFDGLPAPVGRIDLRGEGLNGLLDRVGQLGLLGNEEMMGTRMMIGMFGRPVGPDQIESTIELTPGGGVSVNGMQMQ